MSTSAVPQGAAEPDRSLRPSGTQVLDVAAPTKPFRFADGSLFNSLPIAFETYGTLSPAGDNAVLVFHALSGSQHAAGVDPYGPRNRYWTEECHRGWWDDFIGAGKAVDTREFFVICANYPGGCYGSIGPSSIDAETGRPWGSRFPSLSIRDVVDANMRLLDQLGIRRLHAVVGASLGGCCAIDLAVRYPARVGIVVSAAAGLRATSLARAHNIEQILAIETDPGFRGGDYYDGPGPVTGLALARMISHKTFVSLELMESRARNEVAQPAGLLPGYRLRHPIESYLIHQGLRFVPRFDANSYLRIIAAWQGWDLPSEAPGGDVAALFSAANDQQWLLFSIDSDVCFYPEEQTAIAELLRRAGVRFQHLTVHSQKGHDSFLLDPDLYSPTIRHRLLTGRMPVDYGANI